MRILTSVRAMQRLVLSWKQQSCRIGFVPTMGFLHDGHMSLVRRARKAVGNNGKVVVSIFVNPTQFAPTEDLSRYPRDFARDRQLCEAEGVDAIFAPGDADIYPPPGQGGFSTFVQEEKLSKPMEGITRPTHFRGVTTIVAKLFNIVLPDVAVFGAKDYQQAAVIRRMVRDLNIPLRMIVAPTRREPDGLAMSSRNKYLDGGLRRQARVLWASINKARELVRQSKRGIPAPRLRSDLQKLISREPDARLDYVEFFDPESLEPHDTVHPGTHMALAVFVGDTRLIDNARL